MAIICSCPNRHCGSPTVLSHVTQWKHTLSSFVLNMCRYGPTDVTNMIYDYKVSTLVCGGGDGPHVAKAIVKKFLEFRKGAVCHCGSVSETINFIMACQGDPSTIEVYPATVFRPAGQTCWLQASGDSLSLVTVRLHCTQCCHNCQFILCLLSSCDSDMENIWNMASQ